MLRTVSLLPAFEFVERKEKKMKRIKFTRNLMFYHTKENKKFQIENFRRIIILFP